MSPLEHVLACLAEECSEVIHATTKAMRFGWDDGHPNGSTNNAQDMVREINDLLGVIEVLKQMPLPLEGLGDPEQIAAKQAKVLRLMAYAEARGALQR
jgi:hypothetical protein